MSVLTSQLGYEPGIENEQGVRMSRDLWRRLGVLAWLTGIAALGMAPVASAAPPTAVVDVAVATLWTNSSKPRAIDRPALTDPVDPRGWLANMSTDDRRALTSNNATQTQALYGRQVDVLSRAGDWVEIAVPGQPTPKDPRGYPGWVPAAQLTQSRSYAAAQAHRPFAQVDGAPTAWLYRDQRLNRRALEISFNTRLPVLGRDRQRGAVHVATPDGPRWISGRMVSVYRSTAELPHPTGADLVRTAESFLGVDYVWAGRSGWMFDCSGLTGTVYEAYGITIGRDTGAQATESDGTRVAGHADQTTAPLQPGDLMFYASDEGTGSIYHVAMYAGDGQMVEAYAAGVPTRLTPVRFGTDYWGAVRYLR
jgi:gamma-D-glutamyl-L-lysine dipeptidyl-peptidase